MVSYEYERRGRRSETNPNCCRLQSRGWYRELGLDDIPEPVHWRTKRDIRGIGWTRASSEEGNELAAGTLMMDPEYPPLENGPGSLSQG